MSNPKKPSPDGCGGGNALESLKDAMFSVVQILLTDWSKEYRGGPSAAERNRVPEVLPLELPVRLPEVPAFVVHSVLHRFGSVPALGRLPKEGVYPIAEPFEAGSITARWLDEELHVSYAWSFDAGMPRRYSSEALRLQPGQWGRVRYNARISALHTAAGFNTNDWWYEKWVFNVGLFPELRPDLFLRTEPAKIHSQMSLLR